MKKLLVAFLILLAPLAPLGAEAFFFSPGGGSGGSISAVGTTDNQALLWNNTTKVWYAGAVTSASGGDVASGSTSADGEMAVYNGTGGKTIKRSLFVLAGPSSTAKTYTFPNANATIRSSADNIVMGPAAGSTDTFFAYFDGTDGRLLKNGQSSVNPTFNSLNVYGTTGVAIGGTSAGTEGKIVLKSGVSANSNTFTIAVDNTAGGLGATIGWTFPKAAPGGNDYLVRSSTAGVISYVDPTTIGGGDDLGAAASADVIALFNSGTCSGYLKSDGLCDSPSGAGTVTGPAVATQDNVVTWGADNTTIKDGGVALSALARLVSPSFTTPTLGAATATTLNTGQGANELYAMDQNVRTTDNVVHDTVTANEFISNAADNTRGATVGNTADPSGAYLAAGKLWFNNTTNLLKVRNGDNSATLTYYPTGTMTDTKYCIFTTGTGIVCDTTPAGGGDMSAGSAYGGLIFGDTYPPDAEGEIGYSTDVVQYFGTAAVRTLAALEKANAWTLAQTFTAAPVANAGADVKNGATGAGFIRFFEDSDNGTNSVTLAGPASTADVTITLPAIAGTVALTADPVFTSSLQLPNGANPTVDAAGEIAVDTSATAGAGLRVYAHATYGATTLPLLQTRCTTIDNVIATSDYPIEKFQYAITIRAVHLYQVGATNVVGQLDECTGTAGVCSSVTAVDSADITGTDGAEVNDDGTLSNPGIAAGNRIMWRTTSVSGTNTYTQVCFDFTVDAVN